MNIAQVGEALLKVREAHRYCTSNPLYPNSHQFENCPMFLFIKQLVHEEEYLNRRDCK